MSDAGTNDGIGTGAIVGIVIGSLLLVGGIVVSVSLKWMPHMCYVL